MTTLNTFRAILLGNGGVSALVSSRIYPIELPQSPTFPAITLQIVAGESVYSSSGLSNLENSLVQVDCWARTYADADALFEAVRKACATYSGNVSGVDVQGIFLEQKRDLYDSEAKLNRRSADFSVWMYEAT